MTLLYLILILFSIVGLSIGSFFIFRPEMAIEIQRRFYAKINWRIEPISIEKELRNTRIMGFVVFFLLLATLFYLRNAGSYFK